jgi:hypothetical protein
MFEKIKMEDQTMATKKTVKKAKRATKVARVLSPKAKAELIAGKFKPASVPGKMLLLLQDGKPRTEKEIVKAIKPPSPKNIGHQFQAVRSFGLNSKKFKLERTEEGKLQLHTKQKFSVKQAEKAA